jgi:hypothetical protein
VIVGSKRALAIAAKRAQTKKRGTMLRERIARLVDPSQRHSLSLDFSE